MRAVEELARELECWQHRTGAGIGDIGPSQKLAAQIASIAELRRLVLDDVVLWIRANRDGSDEPCIYESVADDIERLIAEESRFPR